MRTGPVGSVTFQCSSSGAKKHHHFSTVLHLGFDWSLLGLGNLGLLGCSCFGFLSVSGTFVWVFFSYESGTFVLEFWFCFSGLADWERYS
jgi:hypothetical protein